MQAMSHRKQIILKGYDAAYHNQPRGQNPNVWTSHIPQFESRVSRNMPRGVLEILPQHGHGFGTRAMIIPDWETTT